MTTAICKEVKVKTALGDTLRLQAFLINGALIVNSAPYPVFFDDGTELPPADETIAELFKVKVKNPIMKKIEGINILHNRVYPIKDIEAKSILERIPKDIFLFASAITAKAFRTEKILVGKRLANKSSTGRVVYSARDFFIITGNG
jgi:hypothetical protein